MIFTPVARPRVWFSIWATRHKDFAALPNSSQGEYAFGDPKRVATLPATDIDWNQAVEFCNWLTKKERSEGLLNNAQSYRLPSDFEWSVAVGLENEDEAASVTERIRKANDSFPEGNPSDGIYPWGKGYPPPDGVGNYGKEKASVGHYPPNRYGLYDMGGNVEEWCQDTLDWGQGVAIIRGIAATFASTPREKASAARYTVGFDNKSSNRGFRCVLVTKSLH
jgi:formylglycine-generating enzyme required for sulfatase activity